MTDANPRRHKWAAKVEFPLAHKSERECLHGCGIVKTTRHEGRLHWVEYWRGLDRIGVQRKWLQQPPKASWVHFDIALIKKALAIRCGAVLTDKYGPLEHLARIARDQAKLDQIALCRTLPRAAE